MAKFRRFTEEEDEEISSIAIDTDDGEEELEVTVSLDDHSDLDRIEFDLWESGDGEDIGSIEFTIENGEIVGKILENKQPENDKIDQCLEAVLNFLNNLEDFIIEEEDEEDENNNNNDNDNNNNNNNEPPRPPGNAGGGSRKKKSKKSKKTKKTKKSRKSKKSKKSRKTKRSRK